jgi:DNA repair exonuclease SbcCD ATPase subunit
VWIQRLGVRDWRGLQDTVLDELSPHLNLITGPNESGKSRLVQALRFALFESSQGAAAHKKALSGWQAGAGRPHVQVAFHLDGDDSDWELSKSYLGRGHDTVLRGPAGTLEGAEAEHRLAQLLQVEVGGPREARWQDLGVWPLLWVEQGQSRARPEQESGDGARAALFDQLTREIGEVAAGPLGQHVLEQARQHYERYYTPKTGSERDALRDARSALAVARGEHERALAARQAIADDARALQQEREQEADVALRLQAAKENLDALSVRAREAEAAQRRLQIAAAELRSAQAHRERLDGERKRAGEQAKELAELTRLRDQGQQEKDDLAQGLGGAREQAAQRQRDADSATQALEAARADLDALRIRVELARRLPERDRLKRRLDDSAESLARIREDREALAALPAVDDAGVDRLRKAQRNLDGARARLRAAAVAVTLQAQRELTVDGQLLAPGETLSLHVEQERTVELSELLTLTVRPGAGDLGQIRDAVQDAEDALARALKDAGVAHLQAAESALTRRNTLTARLAADLREHERLLPEGREAAESALKQLDEELAGVGRAADVDEAAMERARTVAIEAEAARDRAREQRDRATGTVALSEQSVSEREARLQELLRRIRVLQESMQAVDSAKLATDVEAAQRQASDAQQALQAAREAFDVLGGDDLSLALQQAQQASSNLERALAGHREQRIRLEARVTHVGAQGAHEQVLASEEVLTGCEEELARIERQAAAAQRLFEVLSEASNAARERLAKPVVARITPYLAQVFPGAKAWLDEHLQLRGLRGEQHDEDFELLSGGAREQLSLLVRLGIAEVLGSPEPWPLVQCSRWP